MSLMPLGRLRPLPFCQRDKSRGRAAVAPKGSGFFFVATYRKIDIRIWGDERFRSLSAPPPNGRDCWFYLLTNRFTTNIPGLFHAYEETLARDLEWPVEGFREAFGEAFREGMVKADWKAGLIFIPNAIEYNMPESPNVVRSWRRTWDDLPECSLKVEAQQHLKAFLEAFGEAFGKAFREAFGEGTSRYRKDTINHPSPNHEHEQEHEQEHTPLLNNSSGHTGDARPDLDDFRASQAKQRLMDSFGENKPHVRTFLIAAHRGREGGLSNDLERKILSDFLPLHEHNDHALRVAIERTLKRKEFDWNQENLTAYTKAIYNSVNKSNGKP